MKLLKENHKRNYVLNIKSTLYCIISCLPREKLFVKYQHRSNKSEVELTNTGLSMEMEDEPEYTGLKGNTDGYTGLQKTV